MNQKDLQQEITKLEAQISTMQDNLDSMKETLQNLKNIAWDRQSKRESSSMYKVLEGEKESTKIQSNVGAVKVDRDFMTKEAKKHLDNPNLRGMVTKDELLSFPKVAKNVEPEYNKEHKDYTWIAKTNDNNQIVYGSREFIKDGKETNSLLTIHSKTGYGERGGNGQTKSTLPPLFNDSNFRKSASNNIIPQDSNQNQAESRQKQIADMQERVKNAVNKSALSPQTPNKEMER